MLLSMWTGGDRVNVGMGQPDTHLERNHEIRGHDALSVASLLDASLQTGREEAQAVFSHVPVLQQREYFNGLAFESI